jgi:hypothetical protein
LFGHGFEIEGGEPESLAPDVAYAEDRGKKSFGKPSPFAPRKQRNSQKNFRGAKGDFVSQNNSQQGRIFF